VKLTWDEDDPERNQVTRRAFTEKEIDDGDFRAYIASSSGSESEAEASSSKKKNKKKERNRLRNLLLGGNNDDMPEGWGDDGASDVDMEITFTAGLTGKADEGDETTLEKYQRKMREKRKKRKEEVKEKGTSKAKEVAEDDDEFFERESSGEEDAKPQKKGKKDRKQKKDVDDKPSRSEREEATAEELALLATSNNPGAEKNHFDFKAVLKAEKTKGKKQKVQKVQATGHQ